MTIGKLAEKLGLSKSTVSRALSDYPDIAPATKKRVLAAAEKYRYRPSSYAQSIKTGVAKSVALILSVSNDMVQQASLADLLDGLSSRLGQEEWTLTVATAAVIMVVVNKIRARPFMIFAQKIQWPMPLFVLQN